MATKHKTTTAVAAGVTAAALLLGGTFAWTSISQTALNESTGVVNVGGRLHDDFDGENKDVYVENFTDPYNGGQPIYARVRLDEYMEVGSEAGKLNDDGTAYDADRKAASVVDGALIDDPDSWSAHKPVDDCALCVENGVPCEFHSYWKWEMGNDEAKVFLPTFNKDKDSLEADVNGTYQGTDVTDKIYYDDYVIYTTNSTNGGNNIGEEEKEAHEGEIYSVTGTAYYDNDPDAKPNNYDVEPEVGGYRIVENVTHTAKETAAAEVITMKKWLANVEEGGKGSQPGNYWVYDTDGWAYWANPIMPGEATGLLLSGIEMTSNPGEKCYYAINVVGQFATVGDWTQFGVNEDDEDYPSDDAINLLTAASQSVPTVEISGESYVNADTTYNFTAAASRGGLSTAAVGDFEWSVLYEDGTPVDIGTDSTAGADSTAGTDSTVGTDSTAGTDSSVADVTITETETGAELNVSGNAIPDGTTLLITARSSDKNHLGATGVKTIVIKNPNALVPEVTVTLNDSEITNISEITLTVDVMHNLAAYEGAPIVWSIEDASGNPVDASVATVEGDKLSIVQKEGEVTLVVRATCTLSGNTTEDTLTVTFNTSEFCDTCGTKYTDNGFCPNDACTVGQYEPATLSGDTYQVANGGQLFWLAEQVNASGTAYNATLTEDINLENRAWTPIGLSNERSYSGTFDGNGKSITNLSVTASGGNDGLFGVLGNATVKDFSVSGEMTVPGDTEASVGYATIGAVFGEATISGIHSAMNITVEANDGERLGYVAGILGYLDSVGTTVTIENCSYTGTLTGAAGPTYDCIGGIVGYVYAGKTATVNNCLFAGEIKVETGTHMGGILGYYRLSGMTITNCLSYGTLSSEGTSTVVLGAIAGGLKSSASCTVSNNYYCLKDGSNEGLDAYGEGDRVDNGTESAPVTETEITNGTVCDKLNNGGTVWTQDDGTAYPVPNSLMQLTQ